jgi:hypothetical protein
MRCRGEEELLSCCKAILIHLVLDHPPLALRLQLDPRAHSLEVSSGMSILSLAHHYKARLPDTY